MWDSVINVNWIVFEKLPRICCKNASQQSFSSLLDFPQTPFLFWLQNVTQASAFSIITVCRLGRRSSERHCQSFAAGCSLVSEAPNWPSVDMCHSEMLDLYFTFDDFRFHPTRPKTAQCPNTQHNHTNTHKLTHTLLAHTQSDLLVEMVQYHFFLPDTTVIIVLDF